MSRVSNRIVMLFVLFVFPSISTATDLSLEKALHKNLKESKQIPEQVKGNDRGRIGYGKIKGELSPSFPALNRGGRGVRSPADTLFVVGEELNPKNEENVRQSRR